MPVTEKGSPAQADDSPERKRGAGEMSGEEEQATKRLKESQGESRLAFCRAIPVR